MTLKYTLSRPSVTLPRFVRIAAPSTLTTPLPYTSIHPSQNPLSPHTSSIQSHNPPHFSHTPAQRFIDDGTSQQCASCGRLDTDHDACEFYQHPQRHGGPGHCLNCGQLPARHRLCQRYAYVYWLLKPCWQAMRVLYMVPGAYIYIQSTLIFGCRARDVDGWCADCGLPEDDHDVCGRCVCHLRGGGK